ncbi:MAG: hypothetical protein R2849_18530 [Thermomicrobiales bacterium]
MIFDRVVADDEMVREIAGGGHTGDHKREDIEFSSRQAPGVTIILVISSVVGVFGEDFPC